MALPGGGHLDLGQVTADLRYLTIGRFGVGKPGPERHNPASVDEVKDNPVAPDGAQPRAAIGTAVAPQGVQAQRREREHFFGSAKIVAALTLCSRLFGMWRDMTIVWLGANWMTDSFQFAFALPNLFRRLFGEGALSAAFVPVFTDAYEHGGQDRARKLLANAMGLLAALLAGLTVLVQLGLLVWLWASSDDRPDRQFLVLLTSLMLPYMIFVCLLALASAALNCRGHFVYPAAAPILLNVCMIAADGVASFLWFRYSDQLSGPLFTSQGLHLTVISASVTVAGVIQLAGVLWLLKRSGLDLLPRLRPLQEGIGKMVRLMGPALLVAGFMQLSSFFDYLAGISLTRNDYTQTLSLLGWTIQRPLEQGTLVQLTAAQRLYQFPMGVLAISLGTAVFPLLSRYASRGDLPNLRDSLNRALRMAMMEGVATGVGLLVLAEPILKLIYMHRQFTAADAAGATLILQAYVLGMWAYCMHQICTRTFYSLKEPKTPLRVTCVLGGLYMLTVATLVWVPFIGPLAFGLTQSATFSINVIVLLYLLKRRLGHIGGRTLAAGAGRSMLAAGVMAAALVGLRWLLGWEIRTTADAVTLVAIGVPAGALVFLAVTRLLRAPELAEFLGALRRKKQD